jgi:chaperonin cofactor prefoldin
MQKVISFLATFTACVLSIAGVTYAYGDPNILMGDTDIIQALVAAIGGSVLTSSSLFFFVRRIINQYDARHEQHEKDIAAMQKTVNHVEHNFKKTLDTSTDLIMESLNGLKDNLREIITDVAILKDDRKRCENLNDRVDSTSGNVKVLEVQFESLMGAMARLERQIEKQVKK